MVNMQEDINGEHLLTLRLSINTSCCSSPTKKLKTNGDDNNNDTFFALLQARDRMLQLHPRRHGLQEDGNGLHLIHLLLVSATAIDADDTGSAISSLTELYRNVSPNGDPIQRVTAYFADALAARLLTWRSPFYDRIVASPTPEEEFSAYTQLYRASPYYQFAHFTANQAIVEAFELEEEEQNRRSLHVIDFDVSYGFQWPSLIQSLSDKATRSKPVSLRITGFGHSAEELRDTETRLTNFARGCHNLSFEFKGLLRGFGPSNQLAIKEDESLVVNAVFYLQSLRDSSEIAATLNSIKLLNPSLVVLAEKEGTRTPRSFLSRFMESLHYFAAMFDSLDDCLPAESADRLNIEKNHLGREIKKTLLTAESADRLNIEKNHLGREIKKTLLTAESADRLNIEKNHLGREIKKTLLTGQEKKKEDGNTKQQQEMRLETWKERMESHRFQGVRLSSRSVSQAKLLLKIKSHCSTTDYGNGGGFRIFERDEGRGLSLGWQDRHLATVTAWRCLPP